MENFMSKLATSMVDELFNNFQEAVERNNPFKQGNINLEKHHATTKSAKLSTEFRKDGNDLFKKNHTDDTHMQVLSLYTKSIAFAPENSEELALGYGNRSALLLHVLKFKECITDIEKALLISKSDNLKVKLLSRKSKCFQMLAESNEGSMETETNSSKKLSLPEIAKSEKVPCVTESLSLEYNEKYGKHYVANRDIKPGEIIAAEEVYTSIPLFSKLYILCSHCLAQTWSGIPCNFCAAIYCSESCKTKAWEEYHDIGCSILSNEVTFKFIQHPLDKKLLKGGLRLLLKLIKIYGLESIIQQVRKKDSIEFNGTFSCQQLESMYNLSTSSLFKDEAEEKKTKKKLEFVIDSLCKNQSIFTDTVRSYFKSNNAMYLFVQDLLLRCVGVIGIDSFTINGATGCDCGENNWDHYACELRGMILLPCASFFNHSCIANVDRLFTEDKKMIFYTTQPICKGEQLFVNYSNSSLETPRHERQNDLLGQYKFSCDCQACDENWLPIATKRYPVVMLQDLLKIFPEHTKFCKREGMFDILSEKSTEKWGHSENTFCQVLHLIKLSYEKLTPYKACVASSGFKDYLFQILWKRYGLEWEHIKKCPKTK